MASSSKAFGLFLVISIQALLFSSAANAQKILDRVGKRIQEIAPALGGRGLLRNGEGSNDNPAQPTDAGDGTREESPGYLGVQADEGDGANPGLQITVVREGSPAEEAGVVVGDRIMSVDGQAITSLEEMGKSMAGRRRGDMIVMGLERSGRRLEKAVRLGVQPGRSNPGDPVPQAVGGAASIGVTVLSLNDELRAKYRTTIRRGALIVSIREGSPAAIAGLPVNGVIVAANGRKIESAEDLISLVRTRRPGEQILLSYYDGARLLRKTVTLGESVADDPQVLVRPEQPSQPRSERPMLDQLEKAIGGLGLPRLPGGADANPSRRPDREPSEGDVPEVAALRRQVDQLQLQLDSMQKKMIALEKQIRQLTSKGEEGLPAPRNDDEQAPDAVGAEQSDAKLELNSAK